MRKNGFLLILPLILSLAVITIGCPGNDPDPDPGTEKVELTKVGDVSVEGDATTAIAKFSGAAGLTLNSDDFETSGGCSITNVTQGNIVEVTVTFTPNPTANPRVFKVFISPDSEFIKGSAEVIITQGVQDLRDELTYEDKDEYFTEAADTTTIVKYSGAKANDTTLTPADFVVTPAPAAIAAVTVNNEGIVSVTVNHGANTTAGSEKTYKVNIAQSSTKIKGDAEITILQYDPADDREILVPGDAVEVGYNDTTATVVFTSVTSGLSLTAANFEITNTHHITGAKIEAVRVDGTKIEVDVSFKANVHNYEVKYHVSTVSGQLLRPGSMVEVIQAEVFYLARVMRLLDFETPATLSVYEDNNQYWSSGGNFTGALGVRHGNMTTSAFANPSTVGNTSARVLRITDANANMRATQFNLANNGTGSWEVADAKGGIHGIAFDWYPGAHANNDGYLGILDGTTFRVDGDPGGSTPSAATGTWDNQFIAFYVGSGGLSYKVGNSHVMNSPIFTEVNGVSYNGTTASTDSSAKQGSVAIAGINNAALSRWYRFTIFVDFGPARTISLNIINKTDGSTVLDVVLPMADINYNERIHSFRVLSGAGGQWTTYIDNLELLREADAPEKASANINITINPDQNFGITGWNSGIQLSKTATGASVTANVTVGNFDTADWYLNGSATPVSTGKTYQINAAPLRVGINFLTVVVKANGVEYSNKLNFTVIN